MKFRTSSSGCETRPARGEPVRAVELLYTGRRIDGDETLRGDLPRRIRVATDREKAEQERLQGTHDFKEGVRAMGERRDPIFTES